MIFNMLDTENSGKTSKRVSCVGPHTFPLETASYGDVDGLSDKKKLVNLGK